MRLRPLAVGFVFLLAACSAERPGRIKAPAVLPAADELRGLVEAQRQAVHSLRSEARFGFRSPEGSATAKQIVLAERPDLLRVEVFSPFGAIFVLTTAGGELTAWVRDENRLYRGEATAENLARYARLNLEVRDLIDLLLGVPPQRRAGVGSVFFDPGNGQIRLRQQIPEGFQVVAFEGQPLRPVAVEERDGEDSLLWRASFDQSSLVNGVSLPHHIAFEQPELEQSVEITLQSPEANPVLAESLFQLPPPPGSMVVDIDVVE